MRWLLLTLAVLLSIASTHHRSEAQDLYPKRPNFERHSALLGLSARTPIELYHLGRVGVCISPLTKPTQQSFIYEEELRQQILNCDEDSLPMDRPTEYVQQRDLSKAVNLRTTHSLWQIAQAENQHIEAHQLAEMLVSSYHPKRTLERIKLSYATQLLQTLEKGPSLVKMNTSDALEMLKSLSKDALGVQVRSLALDGLRQWHPDEHIQSYANKTLWTNYPQTPTAAELSVPNQERDWLQRGEAAFKARDYQKTIHALQHFSPLNEPLHFVPPPLQSPLNTRYGDNHPFNYARQRAGLLISISLMRLHEYPEESQRQLSIALIGPNQSTRESAIFYQTHLFSRLKRWDESLLKLGEFLKTNPKGRKGREAKYQVGRILHQAQRYPEAIKALDDFISTRPKDPNMYRWFLGWSYFRMGDCDGALKVWKKLRNNHNLVVGPKVRYWTARCNLFDQDKPGALKELNTLLKVSPLGYYALLAQTLKSRILERPFVWKNPIKRDRKRHWRSAAPFIPKKSIGKLKRRRNTKTLGVAAEQAFHLVTLGEEGLARKKANSICKNRSNHRKLKRILGSRRSFQVCDALEYYTGDHGKRWKKQASKRVAWRTGFHHKTARERVGAYPIAYYDLSFSAAEIEKISPWWIMSHMLQESRYRPGVVSYAQAIGLLQILGRTGKRIRAALDWPKGDFFSDQLYDPALSIRYAAWYLHHLSEDLGHPLLAIGAYNGGPMRFADHQDEFRDQPFDVMVEEIGAHESRNYLRKVADHFIRYLALYATDKEWTKWTEKLMPPQLTPVPKRTVGF